MMIEPQLVQHLRICTDAYCAAKGMAVSTVAQKALGDWQFFDRVKDGKTFTARKYDEAMTWFAANWPPETPWPAAVPRKRSVARVA